MLNAKLRTQLERIARDVANDHRRRAVIELCRLAGIPEIPVGPRREVKAQPKPHGSPVYQKQEPYTEIRKKGRIIDPKVIETYKATHPFCEVEDRTPGVRELCSGPLDFHHLISRKRGGDDTAQNGLSLCRQHHSLFHTLGRRVWFDRYKHLMFRVTRAKVAAALKLNDEDAALAMGKALPRGEQPERREA